MGIGPCSHLLHLQVHHRLEDVRYQQGDAGDEQRHGQDPHGDEAQGLHGCCRRGGTQSSAAGRHRCQAPRRRRGQAAASPRPALPTGREEPPEPPCLPPRGAAGRGWGRPGGGEPLLRRRWRGGSEGGIAPLPGEGGL